MLFQDKITKCDMFPALMISLFHILLHCKNVFINTFSSDTLLRFNINI